MVASSATQTRVLVCFDNSATKQCPAKRIATYVSTTRAGETSADYLNWLGICEEIISDKLYDELPKMPGLY